MGNLGNPEMSSDAISQNVDLALDLTDTTSRYFQKNMGHPEPIKIVIIERESQITENLQHHQRKLWLH